jgi:hypothetical protein
LIGRPVDGETKPLRKHESEPHCRFPDHAGGAPISSCTVARFENGIDNVRHFPGRWFVYEALTAIGKDCGHIGKKASAPVWRHQGRHSFASAAMIACAGSGNGELAWL